MHLNCAKCILSTYVLVFVTEPCFQVKQIDGSIRRANLRLAVSDISTDSRLRVVLTNDLTEDASGDVTYFASCLTEDDYRKFREEQVNFKQQIIFKTSYDLCIFAGVLKSYAL